MVWYGIIIFEHADEYLNFLEKTCFSDYRKIDGNLSTKVLKRVEGDICHFLIVTEWKSYNNIKSFAGDDNVTAKYYQEENRTSSLEDPPKKIQAAMAKKLLQKKVAQASESSGLISDNYY